MQKSAPRGRRRIFFTHAAEAEDMAYFEDNRLLPTPTVGVEPVVTARLLSPFSKAKPGDRLPENGGPVRRAGKLST